ncbi:hypothetical protein [Paraurantiacibacter namhicola]|nr:hypothetical protein [Paraurantiacibacter namhicola]
MATRPSSATPARRAAPGSRYHGSRDLNWSRYVALYLAQAGWVILGVYLWQNAFWPSTCQPEGLLDTALCSLRLPDNRGWVEAALMTWLWSTPILILLEFSRWTKIWEKRREATKLPPRGKHRKD